MNLGQPPAPLAVVRPAATPPAPMPGRSPLPSDGTASGLELLRALAWQAQPVVLTDPADLDRLDMLKTSGYLIAAVSAPQGEPPSVRSSIITHKGWLALAPPAAARPR